MNKTKKSFFKLGIVIFSFLLMACVSEEEQSVDKSKTNEVVSSEQKVVDQKTNVEQKAEAKQEVAKTQADDSPKQQPKVEQKIAEQGDADAESEIDWSEIEEEDSWYGKVTNWFGGLFNNYDELQKAAENGDVEA